MSYLFMMKYFVNIDVSISVFNVLCTKLTLITGNTYCVHCYSILTISLFYFRYPTHLSKIAPTIQTSKARSSDRVCE